MNSPYYIPDIIRLQQILLLANTPMYLFKNFQRDQSVSNLSIRSSTSDLIQSFDFLYEKSNKSPEEYVLLYAILIALTFKSDPDAKKFFQSLGHRELRWAKNISQIYLSKIRIENNYNLSATYQSPSQNTLAGTSTNQIIDV